MDNCIVSFVEAIKYYIESHNLTITGFAKKLRVSDVGVARWLSGTNVPSLNYVVLVADFLNCSVDYLLGLRDCFTFTSAAVRSTFAERFTLLQNKSTISMNKLAALCGATSSTVSKWLKGQMPKPQIIVNLSIHFSCSVDYLIGRSDIK